MAPIVSPYVYLILPSIPKEDIKLFLYVEVLILEGGTLCGYLNLYLEIYNHMVKLDKHNQDTLMTDKPSRTTNATNAVLEKGRIRDKERYLELIETRYLYDFLKDACNACWVTNSVIHNDDEVEDLVDEDGNPIFYCEPICISPTDFASTLTNLNAQRDKLGLVLFATRTGKEKWDKKQVKRELESFRRVAQEQLDIRRKNLPHTK